MMGGGYKEDKALKEAKRSGWGFSKTTEVKSNKTNGVLGAAVASASIAVARVKKQATQFQGLVKKHRTDDAEHLTVPPPKADSEKDVIRLISDDEIVAVDPIPPSVKRKGLNVELVSIPSDNKETVESLSKKRRKIQKRPKPDSINDYLPSADTSSGAGSSREPCVNFSAPDGGPLSSRLYQSSSKSRGDTTNNPFENDNVRNDQDSNGTKVYNEDKMVIDEVYEDFKPQSAPLRSSSRDNDDDSDGDDASIDGLELEDYPETANDRSGESLTPDEEEEVIDKAKNDEGENIIKLDPVKFSQWCTIELKRSLAVILARKSVNGLREKLASTLKVYGRNPMSDDDHTCGILEADSQLVRLLMDALENPLHFPFEEFANLRVLRGGLVKTSGDTSSIPGHKFDEDVDPSTRKFYFRVLSFKDIDTLKKTIIALIRKDSTFIPWAITMFASLGLSATEILDLLPTDKVEGLSRGWDLTMDAFSKELDNFHLKIDPGRKLTVTYAGTTNKTVLGRAIQDCNASNNRGLMASLLRMALDIEGVEYYAYEVVAARVAIPDEAKRLMTAPYNRLEPFLIAAVRPLSANLSNGSEDIPGFYPHPNELANIGNIPNNAQVESKKVVIQLDVLHAAPTQPAYRELAFINMQGVTGLKRDTIRVCHTEGDNTDEVTSAIATNEPYVIVTYGNKVSEALKSLMDDQAEKAAFSRTVGNVKKIHIHGVPFIHIVSYDPSAMIHNATNAFSWLCYFGFAAARITNDAVVYALSSSASVTRDEVIDNALLKVTEVYQTREWPRKIDGFKQEMKLNSSLKKLFRQGSNSKSPTQASKSPTQASKSPTSTQAFYKLWEERLLDCEEGDHICHWHFCSRSFSTCDMLTTHIAVSHLGFGQNYYDCYWSGCNRHGEQGFASKQKISRHMQMHTGYRPFLCEICHEGFSEAGTLQQHMRRHTQEKPFVCDFAGCGKAFAITGALTIHKRVHTGDKPFKCPHCGKPFSESSNMNKHVRSHTGLRPYSCKEPGCGKSFARSNQLTRHMNVHTKKKAAESGKDNA